MIDFDETFVDSAAPNAAAAANGKELERKGKIIDTHVDDPPTLLFGRCGGSGSSVYRPSADFSDPDKPVYRCSCPSRQIPCKHVLALLYAWVRKRPFTVQPIPDDIAEKRSKAQARAEKKLEREAAPEGKPEKPRKVNLSALAKKIDVQLEGIDLLETMTHDLLRAGLGTMNAKSARLVEERARQLGDAYLPGAQNALRAFTSLFNLDERDEVAAARWRERIYTEALDRLTRLQVICRRGREYLLARKADPAMKPETDSTIAEWLGHAWQLTELKEAGLVEQDAELVQLYFVTVDDRARREFVDLGAWINLKTAAIQLTKTFRPYKAAKHINEDDAFHQVRQVAELSIYPGDLNPRVRWAAASSRELASGDFAVIRSHARPSLGDAVKAARNQFKDPLADRNPFVLVQYRELLKAGEQVVLADAAGERIAIVDDDGLDALQTAALLPLLDRSLHRDQVALLRLIPSLESMTLKARLLTIVTNERIVRLAL